MTAGIDISRQTASQLLQGLPAECLLGAEYLVCCGAILIMARIFGSAGLFAYIALAVVIANFQVLKAAHFSFLDFPVALGTIVFSSTFLAVDILTEFHGPLLARRGVWMGFAASLLTTLLLTLTLGIRPAEDPASQAAHQAMETLFTPAPALFAASLLSFLVSQHADIWVYQGVRRLTGQGQLWLRTMAASLISALLDNIIFSTLAWVIFAAQPVTFRQLIFTYILGTYVFRVAVTLLQTPVMYGVRAFMKRNSYAAV